MKLSIKILIHFIFWIVFEAINIFDAMRMYNEGLTFSKPLHIALNTIWAVTAFYLFYLYFIRFFEKGAYLKYLRYSIGLCIGITFVFIPIHKLFYHEFIVFHPATFLPPLGGTFLISQCGSLVRGFENWFDDIKLKAELENRNLRNELELLKSQINPHFLFNTINNIDTLIHKDPSEASKSLLTLSDMLRYMLYETKTDTVALDKELDYINNYIRLQQKRFVQPEFMKIDFPKKCHRARIAPFILLPFIENAFKFVATDGKHPAIGISMTCSEELLEFKCQNFYTEHKSSKTHTGGVGLENVKRRLELIYPQKYELKIENKQGVFMVILNLKMQ